MIKKQLFVTLLIALMLSACSSSATGGVDETLGREISVAGGSYTDVTVAELQGMLAEKDFLFVNVHIPFEGDIPDTDVSIPYNQIAQNLEKLPAEKDAKIVLYCRSGSMSTQAAGNLVELGYTNVWNLDGGFNAWKASGLPMEGN